MLLLDIEKCFGCSECKGGNPGLKALVEYVIRASVCRKCLNPPCVAACPVEALVKNKDGLIDRLTMQCVGCRQCSPACPVGANPDWLLDYKVYPDNKINPEICKKGALTVSEFLPEGWEEISENIGLPIQRWRD
ncbi:MAG: hypothetical protein GX817_06570 [Elusimicrobia bacterium]|nr:hypothetical protein [Elusimicrobiota bacterium]